MPRFKVIQILAWVLVLLVSPAFINADIPRLINYQGYLTDDAGQPVEDGEYPMQFRIHDDSIAYSPVWSSQPETILVINGVFNFQLGSKESIPAWIFENDSALWLAITVGSGPEPEEITPRTRLAATPYAFQAYHADFAGYSDSADVALSDDGDWTVGGGNVYRLEGSVGIGTDSPTEALEVVGNAHVEGKLTWREDTSYLAISAAAFVPYNPGPEYSNFGQILEYTGGGPSGFFHAQVQLPQGAEVDRMTCYWEDNTIDMGVFSLYRSHLIDGSADIMGYVETSGESGNGFSYDDSIEYGPVDNTEYAYFIRARLYSDVALYGIVIQYRFTNPY